MHLIRSLYLVISPLFIISCNSYNDFSSIKFAKNKSQNEEKEYRSEENNIVNLKEDNNCLSLFLQKDNGEKVFVSKGYNLGASFATSYTYDKIMNLVCSIFFRNLKKIELVGFNNIEFIVNIDAPSLERISISALNNKGFIGNIQPLAKCYFKCLKNIELRAGRWSNPEKTFIKNLQLLPRFVDYTFSMISFYIHENSGLEYTKNLEAIKRKMHNSTIKIVLIHDMPAIWDY